MCISKNIARVIWDRFRIVKPGYGGESFDLSFEEFIEELEKIGVLVF